MSAETDFVRDLIATAATMQPTAADRIVLARAAARTALACINAEPPDIKAARCFIVDVLVHLERIR